jgi:hypothetical protein
MRPAGEPVGDGMLLTIGIARPTPVGRATFSKLGERASIRWSSGLVGWYRAGLAIVGLGEYYNM